MVENLKHNLLSISKLCNKGYRVICDKSKCDIKNACDGKVLIIRKKCINVYTINIDCWLWHRRLGHASMDLISKISKNDLVKGLPKICLQEGRVCDACQFGK